MRGGSRLLFCEEPGAQTERPNEAGLLSDLLGG